MKKIMLIAIIVTSVSGFVRSAVVAAKERVNIAASKEPGASVKTFVYKENIQDDIADYQYAYGAGMPVVCNYY